MKGRKGKDVRGSSGILLRDEDGKGKERGGGRREKEERGGACPVNKKSLPRPWHGVKFVMEFPSSCRNLSRVATSFGWKKFTDFSSTFEYVFRNYFVLRRAHIKSSRVINFVLLAVITKRQ